ncbi:MAG: transposase [Taibaiella sp.]|nr:transposase [Taibaiella sp.]
MSDRYKVKDSFKPHFITSTVTGWADALSRPEYKDIILNSLLYCRQHKNLLVHAWVLMNNHIHLIVSAANDANLPFIIRDFKKYTSGRLVDAINNNAVESRKEWMLNMFSFAARGNNDNERYQFWQKDYHPVELSTGALFQQRLDYLHENPVRAGIVREPQHYLYSSSIDYYEQKPGLLAIDML